MSKKNPQSDLTKIALAILIFNVSVITSIGQNTWTTATVKNDFGVTIYNVKLQHRYDDDHYDSKSWNALDNGTQGETFRVGYWTGFGRTGNDYWLITFEAEGKTWYCKNNFYCFLRKSDSKGTVVCRVYKENGNAKMYVDCPTSSDCTVSLDNAVSNPNTWTTATVKNDFGANVYNVKLQHRYDNDHYDSKSWNSIDVGQQGEVFQVGYWTGFGRTGNDYWLISFEAEGKVWYCKDNFYCFLRSGDTRGTVTCRIYKENGQAKMFVDCPASSDCTVALENGLPTPNSWATAIIKNEWGGEIRNINLKHRYDNDHFDAQSYSSLQQGEISTSLNVGFWTGFGRTGKDYWDIEFEADGKKWLCKDNFYCYLTNADVNKNVEISLFKDGVEGKMNIDCPVSSDCIVGLTSMPLINPSNGRPFYLIGHRCNDAEDIGLALSGGCNAIECDLQYDKTTNEIFVNHDFANGLTFAGWLNNAKYLSEQHKENFSLIIFDCKFVSENYSENTQSVMKRVREMIRGTLTNSPNPINVIFSIGNYNNRDAFNEIISDLRQNEGISIDEWDDALEVETYFKSMNVENVWYGNGISTMWEKSAVYPSLKAASKLRDENRLFKKIYVWTLARENTIRKFVEDVRVDGVFVNVPGTIDGVASTGLEEAISVISKSDKIRMAKRSDKAFSVYNSQFIQCDTCHDIQINLLSDTTFFSTTSDTTVVIETLIFANICKKNKFKRNSDQKSSEIFWKREYQTIKIPLVQNKMAISNGVQQDTLICGDSEINIRRPPIQIYALGNSDCNGQKYKPLRINLCVTKRQYRKIKKEAANMTKNQDGL